MPATVADVNPKTLENARQVVGTPRMTQDHGEGDRLRVLMPTQRVQRSADQGLEAVIDVQLIEQEHDQIG